jgi:hypothetical protein
MRKRILAVTAATSLAFGALAGSGMAHFNEAADKPVGPASAQAPGTGHMGMQCGAENPNSPLTSIPSISCPAP